LRGGIFFNNYLSWLKGRFFVKVNLKIYIPITSISMLHIHVLAGMITHIIRIYLVIPLRSPFAVVLPLTGLT
jgi:hypothetical protein